MMHTRRKDRTIRRGRFVLAAFLLLAGRLWAGPQALDDQFYTQSGQNTLLDVGANDQHNTGRALIYYAAEAFDQTDGASCGSLINNGDGSYIFIPLAGYDGTCEFTYTVSDGSSQAQARAQIIVGSDPGGSGDPARVWVSASDKWHTNVKQDPAIDLNSYHLVWDPNSGDVAELLGQVTGFLADGHGKPVIVSSDGAGGVPTFVGGVFTPAPGIWADLIRQIQDEIAEYAPGTRHFEHFDPFFNSTNSITGFIRPGLQWDPGTINRLNQLGSMATELAPEKEVEIQGDRILYDGNPVTLMGFSLYGMLSTSRHDIEYYLDKLAFHGINFTREWCLEQWTALAVGTENGGYDDNGDPGYLSGLTPFAGKRPLNVPVGASVPNGDLYDLNNWNQEYFDRMAFFVSEAWKRGIVVQITLFDRAGLINRNSPGRFKHSPYKDSNNRSHDILAITQGSDYPQDFTGMDGTEIGAINSAFIAKVVETLRPYKNVIYEVLNEPNNQFPADPQVNLEWHRWVANQVRSAYGDPGGGGGGPLEVGPTLPALVNAVPGQNLSFSVSVQGGSGAYRYQWFKDGQALAGAPDAAVLNLVSVTLDDAGSYACLVDDGSESLMSQAAVLSVSYTDLTITDPQNQTVDEGGTAVFSVDAGGGSGSYGYEWFYRENTSVAYMKLSNGSGIGGATSNRLTVNTAVRPDSEGFYVCRLTDTVSQERILSGIASLTIRVGVEPTLVQIDLGSNDVETGIALTPGSVNQSLAEVKNGVDSRRILHENPNHNPNLFFMVDDVWQQGKSALTITVDYFDDNDNGNIRLYFNAQGGNVYHGQSAAYQRDGRWKTFSWDISNADFQNGLSQGADFRFTRGTAGAYGRMWIDRVQVTTMRLGYPQPWNPNAIEGSNISFNVAVSGQVGGLSYQWYKNEALIPGATGAQLTLTNINAGHAGGYQCLVTDSIGARVMSRKTQLSVQPAGDPLEVSGPADLAAVETETAQFTVSAQGGNGGYQYLWQTAPNAGGPWTNVFGSPEGPVFVNGDRLSFDPLALEHDGFYRCRVSDGENTVYSRAARLTVLPFNRITINLGGNSNGDGDIADRLYHQQVPTNGNTEIVYYRTRWCRTFVDPPANGGSDTYFYFKVDDNWGLNGNRPVVSLTVTYLDTGTANEMVLYYNAENGNNNKAHPIRVPFTGSNNWKSHTWQINDASFFNGLAYGSDFRLYRASGTLYIDEVTIEGEYVPVEAGAVAPVDPVRNLGQSVTFQVNPKRGRAPYQYQWYKNGSPINGASGQSITLSNLTVSDAGSYDCVVTDDREDQATAVASTLTVNNSTGVDIDLGTVNAENGIQIISPSTGTSTYANAANTAAATFGGVNCRKNLDPTGADDGKPDRYMMFRVDDVWAQGRTNVTLTVDYFDTGAAGRIYLHVYTQQGTLYQLPQYIELQGGSEPNGVWRSHTWNLSNIQFDGPGGAYGVDFLLERNLNGNQARHYLVIDRISLE